jgi:Ca2+-binding EF-hand superfamily protein
MDEVDEELYTYLSEYDGDAVEFAEEANELFTKYNKAGKKYVSEVIFGKCLSKLNFDLNEAEMRTVMRQFDYNNKGVLHEKFVSHCVNVIKSKSKKTGKKKSKRGISDSEEDEGDEDLNPTVQEELAAEVAVRFKSKDDVLRKMKSAFPKNSSGQTKYIEFASVLDDKLGFEFSDKITKALAKYFEGDRKNYVDFVAFMKYAAAQYPKQIGRRGSLLGTDIDEIAKELKKTIKKKYRTEKALSQLYKDIDQKRRGKVSANDLKEGMKEELGEKLTSSESKRLLARIDTGDRGYATSKDFVRFFYGSRSSDEVSDDDEDYTSKQVFEKKLLKKIKDAFKKQTERKFRMYFEKQDATNDGYISHYKFKFTLQQKLAKELVEDDLTEIVEVFDPNDNGTVNYEDFILFCKTGKVPKTAKGRKKRTFSSDLEDSEEVNALKSLFSKMDADELSETFNDFDIKQDGKLSKREFTIMMKELDVQLSSKEITKLMDIIDEDQTGFLKPEEFFAFVGKRWNKKTRSAKSKSKKKSIDDILDNFGRALGERRESELQRALKKKENRDGSIKTSELKRIFKRTIELDLSDEDISAALDELDDGGSIYTEELYGLRKTSGKKKRTKRADEDSEEDFLDGERQKKNRSRFKKGSSNSDLDEIADQLADKFKSLVKDGDMADLEEVFDAIDDKGTGYISKKQFSDVIKEDLNMKISQKNFRLLMDEFDSNGNGKVEYSEFISFCKLHGYKVSRLKKESRLKSRLKNRSDNASDDEGNYVGSRRKLGNLGKKHQIQDIEEKLAQQFKDAVQDGEARSLNDIFDMMDTNGRGYISEKQFKDALVDMQVNLNRKDSTRLFDRFDANGDGKVSIREFKAFVSKHGYTDRRKNTKKELDDADDYGGRSDSGAEVRTLMRKIKREVDKLKAKGEEDDILDTIESMGGRNGVISSKNFVEACGDLNLNLSSRDATAVAKHFASKENRREVDYDMFLEECGLSSEPKDDGKEKAFEKVQEAFMKSANSGYLDDVKAAFEDEDRSESGSIPDGRFRSVIRSEFDLGLSETELKAICRHFKDGNSDRIDYRSFLRTFSKKTSGGIKPGKKSEEGILQKAQHEYSKAVGKLGDQGDVLEVFEAFDDDNEGVIKPRDFAVALKDIGMKKLSRDEVSALSKKYEKDGNGMVDYRSFLAACSPSGVEQSRIDMAQRLRRKIRKRATLFSKENGRHLDLRSEFKDYDTSGSGAISKSDFAQVAKEQGWDLTNEEMKWMVSQFDFNGTGRISYMDFVRFASLDQSDINEIEKRLRKMIQNKNRAGVKFSEQFEWFDTSGTGKISAHDFKTAMGSLGFPLTDVDVELLMDRFDSDFDGKINYAEFLEAFAYDEDDRKKHGDKHSRRKVSGATALTTRVPMKRQGADAGKWSTGLFYDWTHGLSDAIHDAAQPAGSSTALVGLPVAGSGTVGEFLEKSAAPQERRNFFELMFLLSTFEKRLGIQQTERSSSATGDVVIQLGSRLKCSMKFEVG